jgi:hypothetical protein
MPIKRIQRIAAIVFLVCLISPIVIIFSSYLLGFIQSKIEEVIYTWRTQHQVIIAAIHYRAIAFLTGLLGLIIMPRIASFVWRKLLRFNDLYLVMGLIIALFCSGFLLLATGQHSTLYCERIKDNCELNRTGLWWSKKEEFSLHKLQGAYVRIDRSDDGTTERVALLTAQGDIPMTYSSYSPGSQSETAKQINAFVMEPSQKFLQVREDNLWMSVIVGIIIMIISGIPLVGYISAIWKHEFVRK